MFLSSIRFFEFETGILNPPFSFFKQFCIFLEFFPSFFRFQQVKGRSLMCFVINGKSVLMLGRMLTILTNLSRWVSVWRILLETHSELVWCGNNQCYF